MGINNRKFFKRFNGISKISAKLSVWIFIGAVILSAIVLLFGEKFSNNIMPQLWGSAIILVSVTFVSANSFRLIATGKIPVQFLAFCGIISNLIWMVLWLLMVWGITDIWMKCPEGENCLRVDLSVIGTITCVITTLAIVFLLASNVLNITAKKKCRAITWILKVISLICIIAEEFFAIYFILGSGVVPEWLPYLALGVGVLWILVTSIAAIISNKTDKKSEHPAEKSARTAKK